MRVLITADAVGGVWTYATDLAGGLIARGVDVTLALLGPDAGADPPTPGVQVVRTGLPLEWTAMDRADLCSSAQTVARLAVDVGAEVVHLNSPALAGEAGFDAPVVGACHSCLATWWSAVKAGALPEDFRWRIAATARGYAACNALVAPSAAFAEATFRAYGVRPVVVRNGRATAPNAAVAKTATVVAAGRFWDDGKDAATLDAVSARLSSPILALGPTRGPQGQAVDMPHVQAAGGVPAADVVAAFAAARVFVSTAVYEPFGLSVLEAAQAGCALVLSDIATFRELWDAAAVLVPPRDPEAFARAITALLGDPVRADRLGAAARTRARRYGVEAMAVGTYALYRRVLAQERATAGAPA